MLIVLEGLDGAGKSTQLKMVTSYFTSLGRKVEYLHFPRYTAPVYGDLIAKFLRGDFGAIDQVHPQLGALLVADEYRGGHSAAWLTREAARFLLARKAELSRLRYADLSYGLER